MVGAASLEDNLQSRPALACKGRTGGSPAGATGCKAWPSLHRGLQMLHFRSVVLILWQVLAGVAERVVATEVLQALNRFLRKLQRIADEHGVAVVITNQAQIGCRPPPRANLFFSICR